MGTALSRDGSQFSRHHPHVQNQDPTEKDRTAASPETSGRCAKCDAIRANIAFLEVEMARRYLVDGWQSFGNNPGDSWSVALRQDRERVQPYCFQSIPSRILTASPHLLGYSGHESLLDELKAQGLTLFEALERIE